ncbi:MAG: patatin-like phospholipase family protein, partial [Candidatus Sedimenticola sp. 6PFRAG7]
MDKKTVSLVLGSGGARGLAHIGIIQWLNENGYRIESISGSSMGALIGGIYAAGELDTYAGWVRALEKIDVLKLVDFSFRRSGLIKGEKVIETLRDLIGDRNIEDLPISFTAVATNIDDQREVWLNQGSLFDAI